MEQNADGGNFIDTLGDKIRATRLKQNLTQKALAEKSGISVKMLRNYETGLNEPGAAALSWLALALGISADWLLGIPPLQKSFSANFTSASPAANLLLGR